MIISFEKYKVKLTENTEGLFPEYINQELFRNIADLIHSWNSGNNYFEFLTSGSTGKPKKILLSRTQILYSANQTFNKIDPNREINSTLLCISPKFIGGAMVVFRALIKDIDLHIIRPTIHVTAMLDSNACFDLVSMVPMQVAAMKASDLSRFKHILVGGAAPGSLLTNEIKTRIYSTYGMTETASHVAIKELGEEFYETLGNLKIEVDDRQALKLNGSITNHRWIQTNDIIELAGTKRFRWIGRTDHVINSGGIKLNPESIEKALAGKITSPYLISHRKDDRLGQRLVLLIQGVPEQKQEIDFSDLSTYEKPKEVIYLKKFAYTSSGKIDRMKTRALI